MFVPFLLFTCACALAVEDKVAPYTDLRDSIHEAIKILSDNILSMDGNIPLMDDPRRHYAEIMSVVYALAIEESACTEQNYIKDYQENLNKTAHAGIANPQGVVDGTRWLIAEILNSTDDVLTLINSYGSTDRTETDKVIDEEINKDKGYKRSQIIFLTAGLAARELNKKHLDYFASRSKNLSAHKFVITGARKLKSLVMAVNDCFKVLYGRTAC